MLIVEQMARVWLCLDLDCHVIGTGTKFHRLLAAKYDIQLPGRTWVLRKKNSMWTSVDETRK